MKEIVDQLMADWSYDKAVAELRPMAEEWGKRTLVIARALYIAHAQLSQQGFRTDITSAQMSKGCIETIPVVTHTFEEFCSSIKVPYSTARRWLSCYDPDTDYLFEEEEVKTFKEQELSKLFAEVHEKRLEIQDWKPTEFNFKWNRGIKSWTTSLESKYLEWCFRQHLLDYNPHQKTGGLIGAPAGFSEFGLWSFDDMQRLTERCIEATTGKGAEEYYNMVTEYRSRIPKGVEVNDVMRIPVIVKTTLADMTGYQRRETALLLSEIIRQLAVEEDR